MAIAEEIGTARMNEGNRSPANETSPGRSSTEANGSVECPNEKNASNLQTPSPILMTPKVSRLSLSKHKRAKRERQRVMMIQRSQQSQSQSSHGINNEAAATAIHSNTKATSSSIPHNNDTQDRKNGNCGAKKTASPSTLSSKKRPRIDYNIDEDDDSGNHHKGGADVTPLASSKKRRWKVDYHVNEDISDDDDLEHENGEDTNATDGHELLTQPTTAEIDAESQRRDIECSSLDVPQDSLHGSKVATAKNESRQPQNRQRRNHHQDCISPMNEIGIMSHSLAKMQAHNNEMDFETPRRSGTQKLDMLIGHNSALLGANIDGGNAKLGYNIVGADDNHNAGDEEDEDENDNENDEEIPEGVPMDYNQKVAANRKRNQQRLIDLGLVKAVAVGKNSGEEKKLEQEDEDDSNIVSAPKATGMLFATTNNSIQHPIEKSTPGMLQIDPSLTNEHACGQKQHCNTSLFDTFPHREREITLLQSCLQNAVRQAEFTNSRPGLSINEAYIPPPIFVTGPSGTGKTCVVRGVLKKIQLDAEQGNKMQSSIPNGRASVNLGVAYIDCSTIEAYGSGVGAILENTYYQLANDFCQGEGQTRTRSRKGMQSKFTGPSVHGSILDQASLASGSDSFDSATDDESYMDSSLEMDDSLSVDGSLEHDTDGESQVILDEEELMEKKAAKERGAYRKEARVSSTSSSRPMPSNSLSRGKKRETKEAPRRSSRLKGGDVSSINVSVNKLQARRPGSGLIGLLSTPAAFGRSISQFCGVSSYNSYQRGCAFLVLDHASNLLSFTASRNKDLIHTNFLSELLLLPKVMKLNLTIIVITDKLFLENTRINNIEHPMNTLGTIVAAIVPIKCHFGVYSDKRSLRNVSKSAYFILIYIRKKIRSKPAFPSLYLRRSLPLHISCALLPVSQKLAITVYLYLSSPNSTNLCLISLLNLWRVQHAI